MGAKWFCNNCDKEIWKELSREKKGSQTVLELEYLCFCSDCIECAHCKIRSKNDK